MFRDFLNAILNSHKYARPAPGTDKVAEDELLTQAREGFHELNAKVTRQRAFINHTLRLADEALPRGRARNEH